LRDSDDRECRDRSYRRLRPACPSLCFWRRLFAFLLDGLLLGAFGACLGLVAYDRLAALGDWGRAVGFAIALVYFGAMDSELSGGQTLGKRILGVKVIRANGAPLSVSASTLRATIFCVPYFLNGTSIEAGVVTSWLVSFLVFGVGVSIVYLLLFNRQTRQSLHDLAVGAHVVSNKTGDSVSRVAKRLAAVLPTRHPSIGNDTEVAWIGSPSLTESYEIGCHNLPESCPSFAEKTAHPARTVTSGSNIQ
jgi:uncharacterized RDD family membrane protein YckC